MPRNVGGRGETLTVDLASGDVDRDGHEHGVLTVVEYDVRTRTLVVHEAGRHYWASQLQPSNYARAQVHVFTVEQIGAWREIGQQRVVCDIVGFRLVTYPAATRDFPTLRALQRIKVDASAAHEAARS